MTSPVSTEFARLHGFTLEELATNRAGKIHPDQAVRLRSTGRGGGIGCLVFSILVFLGTTGGAAALYYDFSHHLREEVGRTDLNGLKLLAGGGTLLALLIFGVAMSTFRDVKKQRALFDAGQVAVVEGIIERLHVRQRRVGDFYYYVLGGQRFSVSHEAWQLVDGRSRYRVYVVSGMMVSLEPA